MASKKKKKDEKDTITVHLRLRPTKKNSGFIESDALDDTLVSRPTTTMPHGRGGERCPPLPPPLTSTPRRTPPCRQIPFDRSS